MAKRSRAVLKARIRRVKPQIRDAMASLPAAVRPADVTVYAAGAGASSRFGNEVGPPWMGEWDNSFNDTFRNR